MFTRQNIRSFPSRVMTGIIGTVTNVGGSLARIGSLTPFCSPTLRKMLTYCTARKTSHNAAQLRRRTGGAAGLARLVSELSIKRRRVELLLDPTTAPWQTDCHVILSLVAERRDFFDALERVGCTAVQSQDRAGVIRRLQFLESDIRQSENEMRHVVPFGERDLVISFCEHLRNCIDVCRELYLVDSFFQLKGRFDGPSAPMHYVWTGDAIHKVELAKRLIGYPAFPATCNEMLRLSGLDESRLLHLMPFNSIWLDLQALLANLPVPSFVAPGLYHEHAREVFPLPRRTDLDLHWDMPGAFPEDEGWDIRVPDDVSASPPTEQPPHGVQPGELLPHESLPVDSSPGASSPADPMQVDASPTAPLPTVSPEAAPSPALPLPAAPLRAGSTSAKPSQERAEPDAPTTRCGHFRKSVVVKAKFLCDLKQHMGRREFHHRYYNRSWQHERLEQTYIGNFKPKKPRPDSRPLGSVLTNRSRLPGQGSPARLRMTRPRKTVRFMEGTIDPQPRTHMGFDVPRIIPKNEPPYVEPKDSPRRRPVVDAARVAAECDANIQAILDIPSPAGLIVDEAALLRVLQQKKAEAAQKEAEKERLAELERKRAKEEARKAAAAARKAEQERRRAEEQQRRLEEERRHQEFIRNIDSHRELRAPLRPLMTPPSDDKLAEAATVVGGNSGARVYCTTPEGADLRKHDFVSVLGERNWLNDEIVNGAVVFLDRSINESAGVADFKQQTRKCLALNSFFFKSLLADGYQSTRRKLQRHGVNKNNLLNVDTVLMPVCTNSHWTLVVIRPRLRTVAHMDSLNPEGSGHFIDVTMGLIRHVLEEKFEESLWKVVHHEAPRQTNGYDCGVFTVTNAFCIALGLSPIDSYSANDMTLQRKRIACVLLNKGYHGQFALDGY